MNRTTFAGYGIAFLAGAVIGGVVALLYAPKSGKETRQMLRNAAVDVREGALDVVDDVRDFATSTADQVIKVANEASRKGEAVVHAIKT